jgi:hypothetical protein
MVDELTGTAALPTPLIENVQPAGSRPLRYDNMSRIELATQFEQLFARLLAREHVDLYAAGLSYMFEAIAGTLLGASPG